MTNTETKNETCAQSPNPPPAKNVDNLIARQRIAADRLRNQFLALEGSVMELLPDTEERYQGLLRLRESAFWLENAITAIK